MNAEALADDLLALRADVIAAGFATLPREVLDLIQPLPDSVTTVTIKREGERMTDEQFRAWRLQLAEERQRTSVAPAHAAPEGRTPDIQSYVDVPEVMAKARVGKEPVPDKLAIADALAAKVEISAAVQTLAAELGLRVTPSRRGIEARRNDVMEFVESSMDRMHATLMQLRLRELESLLK
jgi:hypothetical protein